MLQANARKNRKEDQLGRIARNRDIALAIRAACERPARCNFDDADGGEFGDQPSWSQDFTSEANQNYDGKRRKLLVKSSPIGTGYPLIALGSRAAYKVAMVHKAKSP